MRLSSVGGALLLFGGGAPLLGGCEDLRPLDDGPSDGAAVPAAVQRVFDDRCTVGCHSGAAPSADLDLTAGQSAIVLDRMSGQVDLPLVDLGNPAGSYLAIKLFAESSLRQRDPMPPNRDLSDEALVTDLAIVIGWIGGAPLPDGEDPTASDDGSSATAAEVVMCGLPDVAPTADNPFDIGDAAGQIPPDIGMALTDNCGCHGPAANELAMNVPPYGGPVNFSTIEHFQADVNDRPVHEVVLERMQSTESNRMPPSYYCMLEDGEPITAADQQLLIDWLTAGAPDAPTWAGM